MLTKRSSFPFLTGNDPLKLDKAMWFVWPSECDPCEGRWQGFHWWIEAVKGRVACFMLLPWCSESWRLNLGWKLLKVVELPESYATDILVVFLNMSQLALPWLTLNFFFKVINNSKQGGRVTRNSVKISAGI